MLQPLSRMRPGMFAVFGSLLVACTTGSGGGGGGKTVDAGVGPPSESGMVQEGILCSKFYSTAGTFVPNAADPPPTGFTGCWPVGNWTFTLTPNTDATSGGGSDTCSTGGHEPTALAMYQFTGTSSLDGDGDPVESFTYTPQSSDPNIHTTIKVTNDGDGLCQGNLLLYDTTGTKVWTMQPELNADDATLSGNAEYDLYGTNQWGG